jgi:hypothetical protein
MKKVPIIDISKGMFVNSLNERKAWKAAVDEFCEWCTRFKEHGYCSARQTYINNLTSLQIRTCLYFKQDMDEDEDE